MESFLKFQDLNITIDQLDKKDVVDEDLMSRTLFIVNSKRCGQWTLNESMNIKNLCFRFEESLLERGVRSVTVEFKWMKDEPLSDDFVKVKKM